tara:strand:- start:30322 stop:31002 length:681 start_codon:yes stop_codon:yes gene_type:complete
MNRKDRLSDEGPTSQCHDGTGGHPPEDPQQDRRDDRQDLEKSGADPPNSLSRAQPAPQPCDDSSSQNGPQPSANEPVAHVVLYQPEIPQNTGNIGRTCVAVGAKLWIVRPAGFRIDDKRLKRAGLDYWQHLETGDAKNWDHLQEQLSGRKFYFFSRFAKRTIWDVDFDEGDVFVFGRETAGLPDSILDPADDRSLRLPCREQVRSLNLATTVGITLYEQQRQLRQR